MAEQHPYPISQRKPYCQGADFQYAYIDTCQHSTQDRYILKAGRILGCNDCESDLRHNAARDLTNHG